MPQVRDKESHGRLSRRRRKLVECGGWPTLFRLADFFAEQMDF